MRRLLLNARTLTSTLVIGGLLSVALWPRAQPVDVAAVSRGPLVATVAEDGVTRVKERFTVSAPVAGRVLRIELEPGDRVTRGQAIGRIRAEAAPLLLDARTKAEAAAAVDGAKAALGRARADEQRARASVAQVQRELARVRELARDRVVSPQELDAHEADATVAEESLNAAVFAVEAARSELQRAQARLIPTDTNAAGRIVTISSPVDGVVLKRIRESETIVPAGEPLLDIGDPLQLEIVSDLLSTDAVRVRPGARAIVEQWGGDCTIDARVRRIEPAGFTKVSALGVEEQRVNVIMDIVDRSAASALGDAFRIEVRVVVWESQDVIKAPTSALFRDGARWAVYRVDGDRARHTLVEVGHQEGPDAEITAGLSAGDRVIVHPAETLKDGARVKQRVIQ